MAWRMNRAFSPLNTALRSRFPKITIYGIGDPAHQAKKSDHNPNAAGRVNAQDYMLRNGFDHADAVWLCSWLIQDKRTKNVIFNRRIWRSATGYWEAYTLDNPHTDHVHHSIHDSADDNSGAWQLEKKVEVAPMDPAESVWLYNTGTKEAPYQAVGRLKVIFNRTGALTEEVATLRSEVAALSGKLDEVLTILNRIE